ncbi:MAG: hypothetical protein ACK6BC_06640 [Cyanobacteriota bacterium]|jgi:hypothetical protein
MLLYFLKYPDFRMRLYQCPACDCLPVRYKRPPASRPKCVRCGRIMEKKSRFSGGYKWSLALTCTAVATLFAPHLIDHLNSKFIKGGNATGLAGSILPQEPVERVTTSLDAADLFSKLEDADLQWQPQEELLPDGSTRILYKRRAGERDLSLAELRALIQTPPTFYREREAIINLLETLRQAGARVVLTPTLKKGAAAEWDHRLGVMRIQPHMAGKGSLDFLRVLNHEAIHVAQSCRAGSLRARPKALGVPVASNVSIKNIMANPVYAEVSDWEKSLELEAYSLQNDRNKANVLVSKECKTPFPSLLSQS